MQLGDTDQAVRVEVVAEQEGRVGVGRIEEARLAVVDEIALVDRLEAEGETLVPKRREHCHELALVTRSQRVQPQ